MPAQEVASPVIARHVVQMLAAVQFNREMSRVAVEIQYIRMKWILAAELESTQASVTQQLPQPLLGVGRVAAQFAGEGKGFGW